MPNYRFKSDENHKFSLSASKHGRGRQGNFPQSNFPVFSKNQKVFIELFPKKEEISGYYSLVWLEYDWWFFMAWLTKECAIAFL